MKKPRTYPGGIRPAHPPRWFRGDGCTGVPDYNPCIRAICRIHDWAYLVGGGQRQKKEADQLLRDSTIDYGYVDREFAPFKMRGAKWINPIRRFYFRKLDRAKYFIIGRARYRGLRFPYFSSRRFNWGWKRYHMTETRLRQHLRNEDQRRKAHAKQRVKG